MKKCIVAALFVIYASICAFAQQPQLWRLPDVSNYKQITTKTSKRGEGPGQETVMDFYAASNGDVVTIHSYRGRTVAFSTHSNNDVQNTYRIFLDLTGGGLFQEIAKGTPWQIPAWAR